MIAWNAWEIKNAEQDVDIRDTLVNGLKKVPLGNFRALKTSSRRSYFEIDQFRQTHEKSMHESIEEIDALSFLNKDHRDA